MLCSKLGFNKDSHSIRNTHLGLNCFKVVVYYYYLIKDVPNFLALGTFET